jgi:hypothetical protein
MRQSNWADYRARKWTFWTILVFGLVATLGLAEVVLIDRYGWRGLAIPAAVWFCATLVAAVRWQAFRCPRCSHRFFRASPPLLALRSNHCVHCMQYKD